MSFMYGAFKVADRIRYRHLRRGKRRGYEYHYFPATIEGLKKLIRCVKYHRSRYRGLLLDSVWFRVRGSKRGWRRLHPGIWGPRLLEELLGWSEVKE